MLDVTGSAPDHEVLENSMDEPQDAKDDAGNHLFAENDYADPDNIPRGMLSHKLRSARWFCLHISGISFPTDTDVNLLGGGLWLAPPRLPPRCGGRGRCFFGGYPGRLCAGLELGNWRFWPEKGEGLPASFMAKAGS